jgi:hypothetical protein
VLRSEAARPFKMNLHAEQTRTSNLELHTHQFDCLRTSLHGCCVKVKLTERDDTAKLFTFMYSSIVSEIAGRPPPRVSAALARAGWA